MTTLGKYELHEILGKGGFGTVYRATDVTLDRTVALKVLHPQWVIDPEFVARFQKEARLMAGLEHPGIVSVYEINEIGGQYFITMRYLPNGSLAARLAQGPLPYAVAVAMLTQVCAALQQLHQRGWVHRDLKPANILFDANGHAVLSDFGLARAHTGSSATSASGGSLGTPLYRAPELWRGRPPATPATDVYALGCVLAEMLIGRPVFAGETIDEILTRHLIDGPDFGEHWPPAGAPPAVAALVERALKKDPAGRFADAAEFATALLGAAPSNPSVLIDEAFDAINLSLRDAFTTASSRIALSVAHITHSRREIAEPGQALLLASGATPEERVRVRKLVSETYYWAEKDDFFSPDEIRSLIVAAQRALTADPDHADAWWLRGLAQFWLCHFDLVDWGKPLDDFSRAIHLAPERAMYWLWRSVNLCDAVDKGYPAGSLRNALADIEQALALEPDGALYNHYRGYVRYKLGDYSAAVADLSRAIELAPRKASFYFWLGRCHHALEDYRNAIADYTCAIELDPKVADYYRQRAFAHQKLGATGPAQADRDKAARLEGK